MWEPGAYDHDMRDMFRLRAVSAAAAMTLVAWAAGGCGLSLSDRAEARDEWTRQYDLDAGGTVEIRNPNGTISVRAGDTAGVGVRAVRIVRAGTDEAAQSALKEFTISESVSPDRLVIDAGGEGFGISIGLSRQAQFDVTVPKGVHVVLRSSNGNVTAAGLSGRLDATSTNGTVTATDVSGPVQAGTTNGAVRLELAAVAEGGVSCETTNGAVSVTLPRTANAEIAARVSNGAIRTDGLELDITHQSRRQLDATLGAGGPRIRLETTNGAIRVQGR